MKNATTIIKQNKSKARTNTQQHTGSSSNPTDRATYRENSERPYIDISEIPSPQSYGHNLHEEKVRVPKRVKYAKAEGPKSNDAQNPIYACVKSEPYYIIYRPQYR